MSKEKTIGSPILRQCFATGSVCMNIVGFGAAMGFPAILLPQLKEPGSIMSLTRNQESWIASITGILMLAGAFVMFPLMQIRRKTAHLIVIAPVLAGWVCTILAKSYEAMLIGRILIGFAFGMIWSLRSVLVGEYTSPKNRGAFLTTITLAQAFGIFMVHLLGSFLSWKSTAFVCMMFHVVSFLMIIFSPESPSWLASQGKYDECRKAFRWLRGDDENEELEAMIKAREALRNNTATQTKTNRLKTMRTIVKKKEFYKPILIMVHASSMMHFTGGTTMSSYSTKILGMIMGPDANVHFWMIFLDTQRLLFNTAAVYVINRTKRRTMLFSVGAISVFSHLGIAAYVILMEGQVKTIWLPALLVNIQIFAIAVGMIPIPNVMAGELIPLEYKGIAAIFNMVSSSTFFFVVLKTFPNLIDAIGLGGTYILFSGVLTYNLVVIWFLMPETKGKTLQEIEDEFRGRPLAPEELEARKSLTGEKALELEEYTGTRKKSDFGSVPYLA